MVLPEFGELTSLFVLLGVVYGIRILIEYFTAEVQEFRAVNVGVTT